MPTRLLATATETARELPIPAWAFGLLAIAVFVSLFLVLWAFRSVANKH